MTIIKWLIILICMINVSCQAVPRRGLLSNKEMLSFAKEVRQSDNLIVVDYGGGAWEQITKFSFTFESPAMLDVNGARGLYVDISTRFLNRINSNEEIRPYLAEYPFTIHNLDLMIMFPSNTPTFPSHIVAVSMGKNYVHSKCNSIMYMKENPNSGEAELVHEELYQKAVEIVRSQQSTHNR